MYGSKLTRIDERHWDSAHANDHRKHRVVCRARMLSDTSDSHIHESHDPRHYRKTYENTSECDCAAMNIPRDRARILARIPLTAG